MQQVAEAAAVSKNTVSLALRGSRLVSKETRERVLAVVEEVGYRLNPAMSKLMSEVSLHPKRRKYLVLAFFNHFTLPFESKCHLPLRGFYRGALRQAKLLGYDVHEYPRPKSERAKLQRDGNVWSSGIDGLVVFPFEEGHADDDLSKIPIPKVTLGYTWAPDDGSRVACDYFGNIITLYRKLTSLGCKRIGILIGDDLNRRTALRLTGGYFAASAEAGHRSPPGIFRSPEIIEIQRFSLTKSCDALLVGEAINYKQWKSACRSQTSQIRIASYCLTPSQREHGLAGMDENYEAVGEVSITLLAAMIQASLPGNTTPLSVRIPGIFCGGKSLRP